MKLVIIGNGFDLAHEIKSSYRDFKKYLTKKKRGAEFQDLTERDRVLFDHIKTHLGNRGINLWTELEKATNPLADLFYNWNSDNRPSYLENRGYVNLDADIIRQLWDDFSWVNDFQLAFDDWVSKLNNTPVERMFNLPIENVLYFSFNYTNTLERVYGISDNQIIKIHVMNGNDDDSKNVYIFGNREERKNACIENAEIDYLDQESKQTLYAIHMIQHRLYKDCMMLLGGHEDQLCYDNISDIDVMGCSFNEIDYPYFETIKANVSQSTRWHLFWHKENDKTQAERYKDFLQLDNCDLIHDTEFYKLEHH